MGEIVCEEPGVDGKIRGISRDGVTFQTNPHGYSGFPIGQTVESTAWMRTLKRRNNPLPIIAYGKGWTDMLEMGQLLPEKLFEECGVTALIGVGEKGEDYNAQVAGQVE